MCARSLDRIRPYDRLAKAGTSPAEAVAPDPRWGEQVPPIAQSMFQTIVEQGPGAVYLHDIGEVPTWMKYVGPRIEPMLGYPASSWTSDPRFWCQILHPEDRDWVTGADRAAIEGGLDLDIEYRSVHRDGRVIWIHNRPRSSATWTADRSPAKVSWSTSPPGTKRQSGSLMPR